MLKAKQSSIIMTASLVGAGFLFFSTSAVHAQQVLQKRAPVPSYDNIVSSNETTRVTIPSNLKAGWIGQYKITFNSLVSIPDYTILGAIKFEYFGEQPNWSTERIYKYNPNAVYEWTSQVAKSVDTEALEPKLTIVDNHATEFVPPRVGKKLDRYHSTIEILKSLESGKETIDLAVLTTSPKRSLDQLNDLGISELIGRGESDFAGSPSNRIHNIKVGAEKIRGVIVKPGEEFSFNDNLGPVDGTTGFLPELVIKGNDTIPEFGGGLCQVSSTTFRAIMHAGLPVTQRKNHSYAVQYYAPQGSDATIYPGVVDLKFKNDTSKSILVWPWFKSSTRLVFDFYGTDDGREVTLNNPVTYDKKSNGAMKATWTRIVKKNGVEEKDSFSSIYRPPADFHRSERFVDEQGKETEASKESLPKPDSNIEFFVGENPNNTSAR